jgi:hypothetical protein
MLPNLLKRRAPSSEEALRHFGVALCAPQNAQCLEPPATGDAELQVKDPDSTDGLLIRAYSTGLNGGMVTLEIATIYCPEDYSCTGSPG